MPNNDNVVMLDPSSPEYDTPDQAARALTGTFDPKTGRERAGAIVKTPTGKYKYTSTTSTGHDDFDMRVRIPKDHTFAGIVHNHPGEDDVGQVFSPQDVQKANSLRVPSYVLFEKDGSVRKYVPGQTKTRTMGDPSHQHFSLQVADGDPVAQSAPAAPSTPTAQGSQPATAEVAVTGQELSGTSQDSGAAWLAKFGPDQPPESGAPPAPDKPAAAPPNLPPGAHDVEEVPQGNQAQIDRWKKTGKGPDGKPHSAMVLDTQAPTTGNSWLDQFGAESPPEPPPPAPEPPPPGLLDRAKAAAGQAYSGAVDATSRGMDVAHQADQEAAAKLYQPISGGDGVFTRFAKNYLQSRTAANQQLKESGNTDFSGSQLDPRNVAEFAAKASLALINEGWTATGIPAAITTLMSQPTQQLLDAGADALNKSGLVKQGPSGQPGFGITTGDISQAASNTGDLLDQVYQNIVPLGPHLAKEHFNPSSFQADTAAAQPVAPPGTLAERRATTVQEQPETMMEHAQAAAMKTVEAQGGDKLSQVVAATDVNATLGAHYHAGEYEGHVATRHAQVAEEEAANAAQAAEEERNTAFQQFQESEAGKASAGKTPDDIWAARDQGEQTAKEVDFGKALNQKGEQEIERGETLAAGTEKGGAMEPGPTIGEALPPETVKALQSLKERRAAEAPKSTPADTTARIAAATPEGEGFTPLPPGAKGEEPSPVKAPPAEQPKPVTVKPEAAPGALAGRRATATLPETDTAPLDMALPPEQRAIVREGVAARRAAAAATEGPETLADKRVVADNLADKRMQAIKAAAEKRQLEPPTPEMKAESPEPVVGKTEIAGEPVAIQVPRGQTRNGGRKLEADYGEFTGKTGADGDNVDVLIGKHPSDAHYIVDHLSEDGTFEQHKVLSNFSNKLEAMRAYRAQYPDNPQPHVSEVNSTTLKGWLNGPERMRDGPFDVKGSARASEHAQGNIGIKGRTRFADVENNASGESKASLEAIRRVKMEKEEGKTRHLVDPDGNATPLTGVDAVDAKAPKGHIIVQADGKGGHTILDRGGLSQMHANGLLNRARARGLDEPGSFRNTGAPKGWDHVEADTNRAKPLTRLEAQRTLSPLLDQVGRKNVQVHQDATTLPDNIRKQMDTFNHPDPRGVYERATDTVHIVAGAHESHARILQTAIHEIVGHKGLRHLFGDDYAAKMEDLYKGITNKAWMSDYAKQHNTDLRTVRGRQLVADEYVAHLAEHSDENPSLWRQVVDSVRGALRKLGVVRDWTEDDIRALVRKARSNLIEENADAAKAYADKGDRFADEDDGAPKVPDDHPLAVAHKLGKTMEDQANYNPGFVRSRLDFLEKKGIAQPDNGLQFLGLRNLKDMNVADRMPDVEKFIRTHDQMTGRRGQIMEDRAATTRDWSRWVTKNKEQGKTLGELMHSSTLAGVDPSRPFKERWPGSEDVTQQAADKMRKSYYDKASKAYNALDPKGKELFNKVRDDYSQHRQQVFDALERRIQESAASDETKKSLLTAMRQKFEAGRVQSPYFPLQRFGEHWAAAKDADGNVASFSRFETSGEKRAWIAEMKAAGYDVRGGERMDSKSMMEQINPDFVKKVTQLAREADPTGGLADDIWQEYLKAMPEMSMRKHFIHRQGRLGYSMDAMRAYSYNSFHGSHQLSRLEYGNRLDNHIEQIKQQAQALNDADPASADAKWANATAREMQRRYDWIKNPRASAWASALTKFGFGWYLGAAPATAFRIFSQNPMIASPVLAAYHGQFGATKELSKASAQWAMSRGGLGDTLRGDERKAFDTARDMGVFSSTATQDLADSASGGNITGTQAKVMKAMGYMFNAMEHHNRQTTYLAAYRLGRAQGMDHDAAVEHATDRAWDSHFDYTNANRPRVLQNDFAKVAFLFKQYSWGITYRLARDARDMFNNDPSMTDADRSVARKTFAGMLSRSMLWGGMTGLPTYWIARAGINAMMGDEDKPYDVDAALHHNLEQSLGKWGADSVMTGAMGATTGASLASGASYNDLWYRPPAMNENASGTWSDLTSQFMGAIPQIGAQVAQGAQMIHDGNTERGFEHFLPPALSGVAKAIRYRREGVTNLSGEQVMSPEELNSYDLFLQAMGLTPQKVADRYAQNTALKNVSKEIMSRKAFLTNSLERAASMDDDKEVASLQEKIEHFNSENPGVAIGGKGLVSSFRNHFKNQAEAVNGVKLPPGLNDLRDTYGGNPDAGEQQ